MKSYIKKKFFILKININMQKLFLFLSFKIDFLKDEEQIIIDDLEKLKPIIKDIKFNAIYIIGFNYKDVYEYFMKSEKVLTLF